MNNKITAIQADRVVSILVDIIEKLSILNYVPNEEDSTFIKQLEV